MLPATSGGVSRIFVLVVVDCAVLGAGAGTGMGMGILTSLLFYFLIGSIVDLFFKDWRGGYILVVINWSGSLADGKMQHQLSPIH